MAFKVQLALIEDVPHMAQVCQEAFDKDLMQHLCFVNVPQSTQCEGNRKHFEDVFSREGVHFFKALDVETGKIVGFSKWQYPYRLPEGQIARNDDENEDGKAWYDIEGANVELCSRFFGGMDEKKKIWYNTQADFYLHMIAVTPAYHRRGIGAMLLEAGLKVVDDASAKAYIEASPMGLSLYLRHGWKKVDEIVIDLRDFGENKVVSEVCLLREPRTRGE